MAPEVGGGIMGLGPSPVGPGLTPVRAGIELEDTHMVAQGMAWRGRTSPTSSIGSVPHGAAAREERRNPQEGCVSPKRDHTQFLLLHLLGAPAGKSTSCPCHMESDIILSGIGAGGTAGPTITPDQPGRRVSHSCDLPILLAGVSLQPGEEVSS